MPGFCANIVLTFILGVESFDYAVDRGEGGGGESARAWLGGERQMGDMTSRWGKGESNPQDAMGTVGLSFVASRESLAHCWNVTSLL